MGAGQLFSNLAATQSTNAPLGSGDLTLTVTAATGVLFRDVLVADEYELLTLLDDPFAPTVVEIVKVTAHDGGGGSPDDFTIVRGQEGTTPAIWPAGTVIQARNTADTLARFAQGDPGGDARGLYAINIQRDRDAGSYVASGSRAIAIGQGVNRATGNNAVAIGNDAYADGNDSLAAGFYAEAQDNGTTALGNRASAQGYNSTAVGYSANTFHNYALAIQNCQSGGYRSIQMGAYSSAGNYGIAMSYQASAGDYGISIGGSSSATTGQSLAVGYSATAGIQSVAVGGNSTASSSYATAVGRSSTAGNRSVALGHTANATGLSKIAIGAYTTVAGDYAHAIGYSASAAGSNALAVGHSAIAGGNNSLAIGYGAYAESGGSVAIGYGTYVGDGSVNGVGIGFNVTVEGSSYTVAIGSNADANGFDQAIALGMDSRVVADNVAHIAAPIINIGDHAGVLYSDAEARIRQFAGAEIILMSKSYDLTDGTPFDGGTLADKNFWVLPSGTKFYPDEIGLVTDTYTAVTTGPTVSFGHGGSGTQILNNQLVASGNLGQSGGRGEYTSGAPEGVSTISISMNTGATATALTGRFYIRGMFVENGS